MDETRETLGEQIKTAPKEIRNFLSQNRWSLVISEIAKKNNFSSDQSTALENEVLFVLIGLEFFGDFKTNIQRELSIPELFARDIDAEVQERIFKEVKGWLPKEKEPDNLQPTTNSQQQTMEQQITSNAQSPAAPETPTQATPTTFTQQTQLQEKKWWEEAQAIDSQQPPTNDQQPKINKDVMPYREELTPPEKQESESKPNEPLFNLPTGEAAAPSTSPSQAGHVPLQTAVEEKLAEITGKGAEQEQDRVAQYRDQDPYREPPI
ncbi:hypothetical protein EPN83_03485 [Patescibacteria group bacterium]|nr:MAG: hypothetical protein EPN83_03485 [Patescibacteria group bacterium]